MSKQSKHATAGWRMWTQPSKSMVIMGLALWAMMSAFMAYLTTPDELKTTAYYGIYSIIGMAGNLINKPLPGFYVPYQGHYYLEYPGTFYQQAPLIHQMHVFGHHLLLCIALGLVPTLLSIYLVVRAIAKKGKKQAENIDDRRKDDATALPNTSQTQD